MIEQERIEAKSATRARGQRVNNVLTAQAAADLLPGGPEFTEAVQDVVGALIAAAGGTYDDVTGVITLPGGGGGNIDGGNAASVGTFNIDGGFA